MATAGGCEPASGLALEGLRVETRVEGKEALKKGGNGKARTAPQSPAGRAEAEAPKSPGERAKEFLEATALGEIDPAFDLIMEEGAKLMRRGTLDSIQGEVANVRRSQRDLLRSFRDARRASQDLDFAIDNNLRKFTVATTAIHRMSERVGNAKESNFVRGSKEFENWTQLRKHTHSVMKHVRKAKLQAEVEGAKAKLAELAFDKDGNKLHDRPRRGSIN